MSTKQVHFSNVNGDWHCAMNVIPRIGEKVYLPREINRLMKVCAPVEVISVCYDVKMTGATEVLILIANE